MNFISHFHQVLGVKNEWSYTSVLPVCCHGTGRDSIIFYEIYSHDWTQLYVVWCSRVKVAHIFVHLPIVLDLNIRANTMKMLALLLCLHTKASYFPFFISSAGGIMHIICCQNKAASQLILCMSGEPSVETWAWGSCTAHRHFQSVHKVTRSNS